MSAPTMELEASARTERRNLVRHFVEMVVAMLVGMALLGMVVRLVCTAAGDPDFLFHHVGLRALVMTANMTLGMAVWMRHRRHSWHAVTEMGGAMFVPLGVLIVPFWAGGLSGDGLLGWMHVLMLPAMAVAMLRRRDEYARDHRRHLSAALRG